MPSQKSRSKEDTWTTKELDNALNDDRERQRRERREKRERKEKSSTRDEKRQSGKKKVVTDDEVEIKRSIDSDDRRKEKSNKDDRQREEEREERRRKRESSEKGSSRHRKDNDDRHKKDREDSDRKSDRHKDTELERKRSDRHRSRNDRDDDRRRHREEDDNKKHDRHRDEDKKRNERHKVRDNERKRNEQHKERNDGEKRRLDRNRHEEDREKRRIDRHQSWEVKGGNDPEVKRKDKYEDEYQARQRKERKDLNDEEKENLVEENGEDYNYDDDFEDYEEDFEEDDDDDDDSGNHSNFKPQDREMSDLLKALDEENARLAAGSDASLRSDYSERYQEKYQEPQEQKSQINRGRTFINFVSAKQRAVDQKVSNKTKKRGKDLLQLIEFDKASFDIFDLPPVKEYELYIRSFGRTDTKQAYIQTNEDNLDRDIQTEEIELCDKWTQYPAEDLLGCGGDDVQSNTKMEITSSDIDSTRMVSFVSKAAQAIGILLNEEETRSTDTGDKGRKSELSISDGVNHLGTSLILKDRYVTHAAYSPNEPNLLLTCFSMPSLNAKYPGVCKGILCVWNIMDPSNPQKYLACESHPTCCCFSPNRAALVCAGMTDGSVVIWDLREQGFMHRIINVENEEYLLRFPTYNTAGVSAGDNHHSPVKSLVPVFPDPTSLQYKEQDVDSSGLSFQLASLEENACVNLWVVTEIPTPDSAGSEVDLGLSPGGKIKLVKSSTVKLTSPLRIDRRDSLQAYDFMLSSCDLNHFYVGTDAGYVIHGVRFGSSAYPRGHTSVIDTPLKVKTVDFSPFGYPYLLAGCSDGSVQLYHTKLENPIVSWNDLAEGNPEIICVKWSRSRAGVFFVLDNQSTLYTFDLLEGDSKPVHEDKVTSGKAVSIALNNDSRILGFGMTKYPQLLIALDNGLTELHSIQQNLTEEKTLEGEFLKKFNERF